MNARRVAGVAAGLAVGGALALLWLRHYGELLRTPGSVDPLLVLLGCCALPVAVVLQIVRTGLLFGLGPVAALRRITRPVLAAHGMNVFLPSMSGDLFEIVALARVLGQPVRGVLATLVFRFSLSISAVALQGLVALAFLAPALALPLCLPVAAVPFVADRSRRWWTRLLKVPGVKAEPGAVDTRPIGAVATGGHLALVFGLQLILAGGLWCLGAGLEQPIDQPTAMGMVSVVDLAGYLPVPLAGVGVNHWGAAGIAELLDRTREVPALLVTAQHAWAVAVGGLALVLSALVMGGSDRD